MFVPPAQAAFGALVHLVASLCPNLQAVLIGLETLPDALVVTLISHVVLVPLQVVAHGVRILDLILVCFQALMETVPLLSLNHNSVTLLVNLRRKGHLLKQEINSELLHTEYAFFQLN